MTDRDGADDPRPPTGEATARSGEATSRSGSAGEAPVHSGPESERPVHSGPESEDSVRVRGGAGSSTEVRPAARAGACSISVEHGDRCWDGQAIDLRSVAIDASDLRQAIERDEPLQIGGERLRVSCPDPGPVHERVGLVRPDRRYEIRAALAEAARERGYDAPQDEEIGHVEAELANIELDPADERTVRRRLAAVGEDIEALSEQVAALRGRVQALDERNVDTDAVQGELRAAIRELTDAETERIAAEQALASVRADARRDRDRRERRLRLQDRRRNLRRAARDHLAERLRPAFDRALAALPGTPEAADGSFPTGETAALAVCRVAPITTPVVVGLDRFPTADAAAAAIDAPVFLVDPH